MADRRTPFEVFDSDGDGALNEEEVIQTYHRPAVKPVTSSLTYALMLCSSSS